MNYFYLTAVVLGLIFVLALAWLINDTSHTNNFIERCREADGFVVITEVGFYGPTSYECEHLRGPAIHLKAGDV